MPVALGAQEGCWELLWKDLSCAKAKQRNLNAWILWHLISVRTTEALVVSGVIVMIFRLIYRVILLHRMKISTSRWGLGPGALQYQLLVLQAATLCSGHRQESQTLGLHCDHTGGNIEKRVTHLLHLLWLACLLECQLSYMLRNSWAGLNAVVGSRKN